jgi:hypothetical protein
LFSREDPSDASFEDDNRVNFFSFSIPHQTWINNNDDTILMLPLVYFIASFDNFSRIPEDPLGAAKEGNGKQHFY